MDWCIENDRPIWLQLCEQLTLRIVTGIYPMGSRIPAVRELPCEKRKGSVRYGLHCGSH